MKKKAWIWIIILIAVLGIGYFINQKYFNKKTSTIPSQTQTNTVDIVEKPQVVEEPPKEIPVKEEPIPSSYKIENVPFQPQAPFANWDQTHDEACEEASLVLVYYYLQNKTLTAQIMDDEILKMVDWQIKNWGEHHDLTASQTAELAKGFLGYQDIDVIELSSLDQIKKEVSQNNPIIVPAAGRLLGNPYYRQPGPVYHMLVVVGYDENKIITNDVGTKRGEDFSYANEIFWNALHDWAGSPDNIESGQKVMIVMKN